MTKLVTVLLVLGLGSCGSSSGVHYFRPASPPAKAQIVGGWTGYVPLDKAPSAGDLSEIRALRLALKSPNLPREEKLVFRRHLNSLIRHYDRHHPRHPLK